MKNIIVIGNGGHSKVIQAMISRTDGYELKGILDQAINEYYTEENVFYDNIENILKYKGEYYFVIGIGDNEIRKGIISDNKMNDSDFTAIIDGTAILSDDVEIAIGTVVMPGVVINPGTIIGKHSIINTRAVVEHDNTIGDFTHISPSVTLAGTVTIGDFIHIGTAATVIPNTTVQKNAVIGAGSVVVNDIEANSVVVGVPAKIIKRRS